MPWPDAGSAVGHQPTSIKDAAKCLQQNIEPPRTACGACHGSVRAAHRRSYNRRTPALREDEADVEGAGGICTADFRQRVTGDQLQPGGVLQARQPSRPRASMFSKTEMMGRKIAGCRDVGDVPLKTDTTSRGPLNPCARAWRKRDAVGGFVMSRSVSFEGFLPTILDPCLH
jgi:hypothetical protein